MNTEQTSKNAQWMEKYLSKRSQLIYTSWWRDQLIVLWILNRQAKIYLPTNLWRCHGSPSIFNHSRNLYAGLWIHCCNYVPWWWEKSLWKRSLLKHTFSWRDKLVLLWILKIQAKIYLPTNWWRCHGSPSIFNHSRNLYAGLWTHCYN